MRIVRHPRAITIADVATAVKRPQVPEKCQNQYSLAHRQPEQDGTLAAAAARGLAFIPGAPWVASPTRRMGRVILLDGTPRLPAWPSATA